MITIILCKFEEVAKVNNTKKTLKNKKTTNKNQQPIINSKIWVISMIGFLLILVGAVLFDQLYKRPVITINNDTYHMDDLSYYFYNVESQYNYYNQLFGGNYWDMKADQATGATIRDVAKEEAVNMALENEILFREAVKNGYSLTNEEIETINQNVDKLLTEQIDSKTIKHNNFTTAYLKDMLSKQTLVGRYREDTINSFSIDKDSIKASIKYDEYRQYDIEYFYISTQEQDTEGKTVAFDETKKAEAHNKISAIYDKALNDKDWSTLIDKEEKELTYKKDNFLTKETFFPENLKEVMIEMENNEVSEIIETEKGFYLVRMLNNNSTESYDKAIQDAILNTENKEFSNFYQSEILPIYDYKINNNELKQITMGKFTLVN